MDVVLVNRVKKITTIAARQDFLSSLDHAFKVCKDEGVLKRLCDTCVGDTVNFADLLDGSDLGQLLKRVLHEDAGFQEVLTVSSEMLHSGLALWQTHNAPDGGRLFPKAAVESDSSDAIGRCRICVMVPALVKSRKAIDPWR